MALPPPTSASVLDQMPPSPAAAGAAGAGAGAGIPGGLDQMGSPLALGTGQLPPEILTGIMQAGQTMAQTIEGLAQMTPELGADWQAVRQLLLQVLSKLLAQGAGPASPTATGTAFPGGGMERGGKPF